MKLVHILSALILVFFACTPQADNHNNEQEVHQTAETKATKAVAEVMSPGDQDIRGTVTFEKAEDGVLVKGEFYGLEAGKHGFHIHQYGDCTAEDGSSAGGHYSPRNNDHGSPTQDNRHMGDMGNLVAVAGEIATIDYTDPHINIDNIIGRGIILHAGEDDLESQPSGAAGSRIACGVIGIAQEK
ncbi:MAG: superoxide dismutase family protein [Balneolaceae bacterium]|nr:superoxide dismutase family protein [Balneolaceae bacterium]